MNGESAPFSKLAEHVEKECRFHGVVARMEIGGHCATCRK